MNENEIKWITASGLSLKPYQICLSEKLKKFGWCADFSGFGEGKAEKAELCILDVIGNKEKPNILIICPERFTQSWYGSVLFDLGVEFKLVSGMKDSVFFFSEKLANLFIMSEETLNEEEASEALAEMRSSGIVWDLMIIDASGNTDGMNASLYEKTGMKAENVILFAPYPASYTDAPSDIAAMVKTVLSRDVGNVPPVSHSLMEFSMDNPYLCYPEELSDYSVISPVSYEFDEKLIPQKLYINENPSGRYSHGGNVFEEYNLEERKIYLHQTYTHTEAEILKNVDRKLSAFLDVIDPIINSEDKTAVVYFCSDVTFNYVEKVLSAFYFDKKASIATFTKNRFDERSMKQWYEDAPKQKLRVVLAKDELDEKIELLCPITSVINYELPDNPAVLQQRLMRRSFVNGETPEFILFSDKNGKFDSRILKKVLAGSLYKAFHRTLPSENVLFRVKGIEQMIADMLFDVKYVADYTGSVGSSFDVISRFKNEYNIPAERNLTTAAKTHEYSKHKLGVLADALGVKALVSEKDVNKDELLAAVMKKVEEIRGGSSFFNDSSAIETIPRGTVRNEQFNKFSGSLKDNPFNTGLVQAQKKLKDMAEKSRGFAYMKDNTGELSDILREPVLYHVWLYWHKELGLGGSYAEFIKAYNNGII